MITIDARCGCTKCEARTQDIYRMVGRCTNCGQEPILMLFRSGDGVRVQDCPSCGRVYSVQPFRRATDDEIPMAEVASRLPVDGRAE